MVYLVLAAIAVLVIAAMVTPLLDFVASPAGGIGALLFGLWWATNVWIAVSVALVLWALMSAFAPVGAVASFLWGCCLGLIPMALLTIVGVPAPVAAVAIPLIGFAVAAKSPATDEA